MTRTSEMLDEAARLWRWSPERRFDNASVYCESWKRIFGHIWERIAPTLIVEVDRAPEQRAAAEA